jgi:hypothetical protein
MKGPQDLFRSPQIHGCTRCARQSRRNAGSVNNCTRDIDLQSIAECNQRLGALSEYSSLRPKAPGSANFTYYLLFKHLAPHVSHCAAKAWRFSNMAPAVQDKKEQQLRCIAGNDRVPIHFGLSCGDATVRD